MRSPSMSWTPARKKPLAAMNRLSVATRHESAYGCGGQSLLVAISATVGIVKAMRTGATTLVNFPDSTVVDMVTPRADTRFAVSLRRRPLAYRAWAEPPARVTRRDRRRPPGPSGPRRPGRGAAGGRASRPSPRPTWGCPSGNLLGGSGRRGPELRASWEDVL